MVIHMLVQARSRLRLFSAVGSMARSLLLALLALMIVFFYSVCRLADACSWSSSQLVTLVVLLVAALVLIDLLLNRRVDLVDRSLSSNSYNWLKVSLTGNRLLISHIYYTWPRRRIASNTDR